MLAAIALTTDRSMNPGMISIGRDAKYRPLHDRREGTWKKTYIGPLMSADFACHKTIDMKGPVTEVLSLAVACPI